MKFFKRILGSAICLVYTTAVAQTFSAKVMDQKTDTSIPFATIQLSEQSGLITNEEGKFSFTWDQPITEKDSIYISSMGYEKLGIALEKLTDSIIYLNPKAIELGSAFVSNKNLTIDEIMDRVFEKLTQNYSQDFSKKRLFFRQSDYNDFKKLDIEFKKSTIEELDKKLIDSVVKSIPKRSSYYSEILGDLYGNLDEQKLNIIKAAELYDKNNSGSMEALAEKMERIFKENVKSNSYLKIKSGLFGTKVQVDSILENNEEANEVVNDQKEFKNQFQKYRKIMLKRLFSGLFFQDDPKLNFIDKASKYEFTLVDYSFIDDATVYIVDFNPKGSADFKGKLYINTEDYAVMRVDFQNVNRLRSIKLLGFMYREHLYKGTTIYNKGADGKYHLKYLEKTRGTLSGVDRPLKVIEKNKFVKGRRKQNELSLGIDLVQAHTSKFEVIVFGAENLSETDYKGITENKKIKPTYLAQYDPNFWQGYNIIEPNTAIKQFKAIAVEGME